ncbi:MAG: FKBP-type peptidyl-prolyl cis-trans isomerase [Bacteroidota bacterium]
MRNLIRILVIFGLVFTACNDKSDEKRKPVRQKKSQVQIDKEKINQYVAEKQLQTESLPSGIHYVIEEAGGEEKPSLSSNITCYYRLTTLQGDEIESNFGEEPLTRRLTGLITGWQQAIPLLGKGGKGTFIIPSGLAYGSQPMGPKREPNSVLVFDIELLDFVGS